MYLRRDGHTFEMYTYQRSALDLVCGSLDGFEFLGHSFQTECCGRKLPCGHHLDVAVS
ncbi:hypothetical protein JOJ87_004658 [Rhodococcus ruber]|nr:hypothetical protein [Rhodococcus ruber]